MNNYQVVCYGEALWDLLPDAALPGGAPMNVAYHLKKMGLNPAVITRIGTDNYGERLLNILDGHNVDTGFFYADDAYPTGLVHARLNEQQQASYDIVFPSAWDFIEWQDEFESLIKNAGYFVFGSLSARNKVSRETLFQCLDMGSTNVMDVNLRPPHFHRNNIEHLLRKTDILKMNLEELELVTSWFSHFRHMEDRMKLVQERFGINQLLVTMGAEGSILSQDGHFYYQQAHKVQVQDTIGSGDSFLAAYLQSIIMGESPQRALAFAAVTGAFVASKAGACPDYELSELKAMLPQPSANQLTESLFNQ